MVGRIEVSGLIQDGQTIMEVEFDHLRKNTVPEVNRLEEVAVSEEHFRFAQEEKPGTVEGEMEAGQYLGLRLGVEVHEGVAAHNEVQVRDGGILCQIVATEDDLTAQIVAERVAIGAFLEVFFSHLFREGFDILGTINGLTSLSEGFLIGIGGVDLYPLAERFLSQGFGQNNRHTVRFLSRRTARAPNPDGSGWSFIRKDARNDFILQVIPCGLIPKERRDVDEDRVEEQGELFVIVQRGVIL